MTVVMVSVFTSCTLSVDPNDLGVPTRAGELRLSCHYLKLGNG